MKKLRELLEVEHSYREEAVMDLCDDSRRAVPWCMFAALGKNAEDRKNHVDEAISRGAKYILQECENSHVTTENGVLFFFVKNVRAEWALIASKFFKSNFENIVAITGTNGKSSVLDILRQIWLKSGIKSASIGTLGVITAENCEKLPHNMTSPDCLELHKILCRLSESGIKNVAMEATSQGIEQHRVDAIKFAVCAFTNFTQDHLDYHQTFENYWNAKARLFAELASRESIFIVNDDDPYSKKIYAIARDRDIECQGYGYTSRDVKIIDVTAAELHQRVRISFYGKEVSFVLPLQGIFQVHNALCAASIAHVTGLDRE
ncbi:MAG: hypothetical protein LBG04_00420, partial [Holosporaceae bacterium]|nr:hypothetical protein [Holosporaceae bacterium]